MADQATRPEIAPERWAVWTARLDEPGYESAKAAAACSARGDRYFAGVWLYEELRARGVDINKAREEVYHSGASVMQGLDPWESAQTVLAKQDRKETGAPRSPPASEEPAEPESEPADDAGRACCDEYPGIPEGHEDAEEETPNVPAPPKENPAKPPAKAKSNGLKPTPVSTAAKGTLFD